MRLDPSLLVYKYYELGITMIVTCDLGLLYRVDTDKIIEDITFLLF